ncbi:MAG: hypothetical protein ACFCBW_03820 [Candidatus Competibacterales bacterium]
MLATTLGRFDQGHWLWRGLLGFGGWLLISSSSSAAMIGLDQDDFTLNPTFNEITSFDFSIDLDVALVPGTDYSDPDLSGVEYSVNGVLTEDTPSGFPAFALQRTIGGTEFYSQGSSLAFAIDPSADFSDGLQVSELLGTTDVFLFNGREVNTGRYHPPLLQLNSDGTGLLRNSNNQGGINPSTGEEVDVEIGEEYIIELSFDAAALTLIAADDLVTPVPLPAPGLLLMTGLWALARRRPSKP